MHAVIGIDLGTTSIKSILFSKEGKTLREEKADTPLSSDAYGSIYRPEAIWEVVKGQLEKLVAAEDAGIDGIAVTGMAEAGLIVNRKTGREATDILPWFERRTQPLADKVSAAEDARNFARTGLHNSFKYGIYKFLWLLEEYRLEKEDAVWLSVCDYIVWKLTGQFVTEPGFAARTYMYDIGNNCWDLERIRALGLDRHNFPTVIPSGKIAGCCQVSGMKIPVALAGHDHVCAAFGLLYEEPEGICDSAGTSETYVGRLKELPACGPDPESGLLYGPYVDGGWFYMANVPSSGHSVEWFRKKLQLEPFSYETMVRALSALDSGPTGLLYFPYLTGMGSPWYEAGMRGSLLGLCENTDGWIVLKAVMEGIEYQAAWVLSLSEQKHHIGKQDLICAGGSANNPVMMQIKADILQRNVRIPAAKEATLAGAAALFWQKNESKEAARTFLRGALPLREVVEPNRAHAAEYEKILKNRYLPMADILKKYYEEA